MDFDEQNMTPLPEELEKIEILWTKFKEGCRLAENVGEKSYDNMSDIQLQSQEDEAKSTVRFAPSFTAASVNRVVEYMFDEMDELDDDTFAKITIEPVQEYVLNKKKLFRKKEYLDNYGLHITAEW
jgi:hypothetical protein